jgi:hypothetical protein
MDFKKMDRHSSIHLCHLGLTGNLLRAGSETTPLFHLKKYECKSFELTPDGIYGNLDLNKSVKSRQEEWSKNEKHRKPQAAYRSGNHGEAGFF